MATATILEELAATVLTLAPQQQTEVLHFARFLQHEAGASVPRATAVTPTPTKSMFGLLGQKASDITVEELKELRREMWQNFPREFPE